MAKGQKRNKSKKAARKARPSSAKGKTGSKAKAAKVAKARKAAASKAKQVAAQKKAAAKKLAAAKLAAKKKQQEHAKKVRERAQLEQQRTRERQAKEKARAREQAERERDRERQAKAKEAKRLQAERERDRVNAAKQKAADHKRQQLEKDRARKANEKERQRLLKERAKEQARLTAEREAEKVRQKAEREGAKTRAKLEREQERLRLKAEKEAERQRLREDALRKKEAEAAEKRAAQDAYRKAKDAEKARLRQEREAARRALEGRVAKAAGRGVRGGARTAGIRVYSPTAIPNQSGTSRSTPLQTDYSRFANLRQPRIDPSQVEMRPRTLPPPPPVAPPESIEDRYALVQQRLTKMDDAFRKEHEEAMLMSWIYHDSALEGSVFTFEELRAAITPSIAVVPDSSMQTAVDEIRRHKMGIDLINELGDKRRAPITIDVVKRLYLVFNPDEGDLKTVKYRKDIPQHRLYFHEYAAPDKIAYKVRQVFDWLAGPEPKKLKSPLKVAARVHYDLVRVFPFPSDSGKVARGIMNILLLRSDYPPALIHSTERQRYYEALRGSLTTIVSMMQESILNALQSIEKKLDEAETRMRSFGS